MRDWRRAIGALCIVLAMVLGAFAGFSYAQNAGTVSASPAAGTRGGTPELRSLTDQAAGPMTPDQALASSRPQSLDRAPAVDLQLPDGSLATAHRQTTQDLQNAMKAMTPAGPPSGYITATPSGPLPGTRYSGPGISAGGPYGGPDTFEGGPPITFTVTAYDPAIIFFRWDFNNDGIYDYPDQTGGGSLGRWTTETTIQHQFFDNYYGPIRVQGWDGVSTITNIVSGDNLGLRTSWNWIMGMFGGDARWVGFKFQAKRDVTVTQLGYYHYVYTEHEMILWSWAGVELGTCEPSHLQLQWNWCTLSSPVNVALGQEYWLALHIDTYNVGLDTPADTNIVVYQGTYGAFCFGTQVCFQNFFWSNQFIPMLDFRWTYTEILPDAAAATATLEIHNVAPTVFGVTTSPNPGLEGSPTNFVAQFSDPGLDDTWQFQWTFHDGTQSPWLPVSKYSGGAKVLILHSWTGDVTNIHNGIVAACGNFCIRVDDYDFGPLGHNTVPPLTMLQQYDVIVIGTNWGAIPNPDGMGNVLADFMDAAGSTGGGVVMMWAGFYSSSLFGIGGRWASEKTPIDRTGILFGTSGLGAIYVPGHPLLDGVATMASYYRHSAYSVTAGATRVADFADGSVLAADKVNPGNGAVAVALPWWPVQSTGDHYRVVANAIRFASRASDPLLKTMPITLDSYKKTYADDHPTTTTPQDTFPVSVTVRDDDDGKLEVHSQSQLFFQNFDSPSDCFWASGSSYAWPAGWSANPTTGWRCESNPYYASRAASIIWYYNDPNYGTGNGISDLLTNTFDFSTYQFARLEFDTTWHGDGFPGPSDGYVDVSTDGGATFPTQLLAYHHGNPSVFTGHVVLETTAVAGSPNVVFRFRYVSNDDYGWFVDNVKVTGIDAEVINGHGSAGGTATIANVPPTIAGGFDSATRDEAQGLTFGGFQISDPALLVPTEWFAYRVNYDDGTPSSWVYKGSLAPPKFRVLVVHTLCFGGDSCGEYGALRDMLLSMDDVGSVTSWNYIFPLAAPPLSTLMQYDVVIIAVNWYYFGYQPFDLVRRQLGDRLADYLDSGRGGVLTYFGVHATFGGSDSVDLAGRYINDQYGAFKRADGTGPTSSITILDAEHDLFTSVGTDVGSLYVSSGNMPVTIGGNNNAAGENGVLLARWNSGNPAIGVKQLRNGARTAHIGAFAQPTGADTKMLVRNAIGWVAGGLPSPRIPTVTHTYGDNGVYTVDYTVIDDDMGYVWDASTDQPVQVIPGIAMSHRYVTVTVDNVDPTIDGRSIQAYIAADVCVRVSGTGGNTVTADLYTDGVLSSSTSVTRDGSSPNPDTTKCGLLKVDVLAPHDFSARLTYDQPDGGSNPTWLVIMPWREPVTPGHGTVTYKFDLAAPGTVTQPLPTLKQDLVANGQGAKIDFVAAASDPGTDDLAFFWSWGGVVASPYALGATSVYTIHVHHNDGSATTDGVLADGQHLGFREPYFDRATNTGRSPAGTMNFRASDTAVHAFDGTQSIYWVTLIVLDDDNGRGYPSPYAPNDGVDMQFVVVNLQ